MKRTMKRTMKTTTTTFRIVDMVKIAWMTCILPLLFLQCGHAQTIAPDNCQLSPSRQLFSFLDTLTIRETLDATNTTVTIELTYEGSAWLGFGFNSQMPGTTAIIGLPDVPDGTGSFFGTPNPGKYFLATYGRSNVNLITDNNRQTLTNRLLEQNGTHTILSFTKLLQEEGEREILVDAPNDIVVAIGTNNDLQSHRFGRSTTLALTPCNATFEQPTDTAQTPNTNNNDMPTELTGEELECPLSDPRPLNSVGTLTIRDSLDAANEKVTIEITYRGRAWLGFGIGASMVGSTAVIGLPDLENGINSGILNPAKYFLGAQLVNRVNPVEGNQQTLQNAAVFQNDTHTILRFTKLVQEDPSFGESDVLLGSTNAAIWAVGFSNDLSTHRDRGIVDITFTPCGGSSGFDPIIVDEGAKNKTLWIVHGALMAAAWALLVPIGISASLLRNFKCYQDGKWFYVHSLVNSWALFCVVAAFLVAVIAISKENGEHFKNYEHSIIGLVVTLVMVAHIFLAVFRPHLPASAVRRKRKGKHRKNKKRGEEEKEENEEDDRRKPRRIPWRMLWEWLHKFTGFCLVLLAWANCHLGFDRLEERYGGNTNQQIAFWAIVGGTLFVIFMSYLWMRYKKYY